VAALDSERVSSSERMPSATAFGESKNATESSSIDDPLIEDGVSSSSPPQR